MLFPLSVLLLEWDFHRRGSVLTGWAHSRCMELSPKDEDSRAREKEGLCQHPAQASPDRSNHVSSVGLSEWEQVPELTLQAADLLRSAETP